MEIRLAEEADILAISQIHIDTWKTAYQGILSHSFLANLSLDEKVVSWKHLLKTPSATTYVAIEQQKVVGFIRVELRGPTKKAYIGSLYLLAEYQGTGGGKQLLMSGLDDLKSQGHQEVFVEVLSNNPSRYFYEKYGAKFKEEILVEIDGKKLPESIYCWSF